jgi:hypothetical protein
MDYVTGRTTGVRFPQSQEIFLLSVVQTVSGAQPAFYPISTGGYLPGNKADGECLHGIMLTYVIKHRDNIKVTYVGASSGYTNYEIIS